MGFLKSIGGMIVMGLVALGVLVAMFGLITMSPERRDAIFNTTGHGFMVLFKVLGWALIVGIVPWASFYLVGRVGKMGHNAWGALLIFVFTAAEAVLLAWMFSWGISGATTIVFFSAATLIAGAYNLFACDWIAEKLE